jgi:hypothetical protein
VTDNKATSSTARRNREVGEGALVYALRQVWTEEQVQNGLATYRGDLRAEHAEEIRNNADSPRVKPHLLEGEWTGMRMAADHLHPQVVTS